MKLAVIKYTDLYNSEEVHFFNKETEAELEAAINQFVNDNLCDEEVIEVFYVDTIAHKSVQKGLVWTDLIPPAPKSTKTRGTLDV